LIFLPKRDGAGLRRLFIGRIGHIREHAAPFLQATDQRAG